MNKNLLRQCLSDALNRMHTHSQYRNYIHYSYGIVDGSVYVLGMNKNTTPDKHFGYSQRVPEPKTHSELDAYRKLRKIVSINKVYWELINVRVNRTGEMKNSKPCSVCAEWLAALGCQQVVYTTDNGWKYEKY